MIESACHSHVSAAAVLRRAATSLIVACVVPGALFYAAFEAFGVNVAMAVALVWAGGATAWRALTGREVSGMLLLTLAVLVLRTAFAVLADSSFLYFAQPALSDLLLGAAFLVSVLVGRPLVVKLAGDFYPVSDEMLTRPPLIALFRWVTVGWALFLIAKSAFVMWLLMHLSLETFVRTISAANPLMSLSAAAVTVATAGWVLRREGLIGGSGDLVSTGPSMLALLPRPELSAIADLTDLTVMAQGPDSASAAA